MILVIGYFLAIVMGFTLGLLGGGGAILTIPIMVYIFGINPIIATAYSLFVVGLSASIGAFRKAHFGLIDWKAAFIFAIPVAIAIFCTRFFLLPSLPDMLIEMEHFRLKKDVAIMILFSLAMLIAANYMIRGRKDLETKKVEKINWPLVVLWGVLLGVFAGLVGAGGGFLIVPILVAMLGLPIKKAIGSSLFIIAVNSAIGFIGDVSIGQKIDWMFLLSFAFFAGLGMFIGIYTNRFAKPERLKKGFGWFILAMGIFIFITETYLNL